MRCKCGNEIKGRVERSDCCVECNKIINEYHDTLDIKVKLRERLNEVKQQDEDENN